MLLVLVDADVVELQGRALLHGDALPVAQSQCPLLARELPVEEAVVGVDVAAEKQWRDVDAVGMLWQRGLAAGDMCQGGHEVGEVHQVVYLSGWHSIGLVDDEGHLDASLVELALASFQPGAAVELLQRSLYGSAVVGGEDDECLLAQSQPFELVEQSADGRVHVGDERGVALGVGGPVALLVVPRGVVDVVGLVRRIVGQVEEERGILLPAYEGDGIVGGDVGVVAHVGIVGVLLDVGQLVVVEPPVGVVVGVVAVDGGYEPSVELVEAAVQWRGLRLVAVEVPLVHQAGAVAPAAEHGGDGGVLGQEVGAPHDGGVAPWRDFQARQPSGVTLVVANAGVARVQSGHQRAARG